MKFTLPWLKDYLATTADLPAILEAMTMSGLEVEEAHDPREALKQFTVCRIVSAAQHPNADKLQVCQVETVDGMKEIVWAASTPARASSPPTRPSAPTSPAQASRWFPSPCAASSPTACFAPAARW